MRLEPPIVSVSQITTWQLNLFEMKVKFLPFTILSLLVVGCGNRFYDNYREDDLWRLPLIKPYELKNTVGATRDQWTNDNWHLLFQKPESELHGIGVNVTMVNVDKGIIYGYGTANPCQHFIINTVTDQIKTFGDTVEWANQLKKLNVDHKKVYDVFELFDKFKNENTLLWRQDAITP
jgi:hypothetical protein